MKISITRTRTFIIIFISHEVRTYVIQAKISNFSKNWFVNVTRQYFHLKFNKNDNRSNISEK